MLNLQPSCKTKSAVVLEEEDVVVVEWEGTDSSNNKCAHPKDRDIRQRHHCEDDEDADGYEVILSGERIRQQCCKYICTILAKQDV